MRVCAAQLILNAKSGKEGIWFFSGENVMIITSTIIIIVSDCRASGFVGGGEIYIFFGGDYDYYPSLINDYLMRDTFSLVIIKLVIIYLCECR